MEIRTQTELHAQISSTDASTKPTEPIIVYRKLWSCTSTNAIIGADAIVEILTRTDKPKPKMLPLPLTCTNKLKLVPILVPLMCTDKLKPVQLPLQLQLTDSNGKTSNAILYSNIYDTKLYKLTQVLKQRMINRLV